MTDLIDSSRRWLIVYSVVLLFLASVSAYLGTSVVFRLGCLLVHIPPENAFALSSLGFLFGS